MPDSDILIIGAGIAGPIAAMALQRAGMPSVVYEAYPHQAHEAGAWLSVAVNGLDALSAIELREAVIDTGFPSPKITFVSGTGKRLGELPLGGTLGDGTITHTFKRAELYRVIYEEAAIRGIRIEHGKRLANTNLTGDGGVTALFTDGTAANGRLLIGADGLRSRVRDLIDPSAPSPRYTGIGAVGGFTLAKNLSLRQGTYEMVFGKHAFFAYTVSPIGEIFWFANPPNPRELSTRELEQTTSDEWKERLFELFRHDRGPAVEIIRAAEGDLLAANQYDLPTVPRWWREPMLVIGDAAHAASPSSGQGASMAIEDAIELAVCLRDVTDVSRAFAAYERRRRARVERIVAQGASASRKKTGGSVARMLRDVMLPRMFARYAKAGAGPLDWMHKYHIDWDASTRE